MELQLQFHPDPAVKEGKDRLTRLVQENYARKTKYCLQKEANLVMQNYMTQDTAA